MNKSMCQVMFWLNLMGVVANVFFLLLWVAPAINFIAAVVAAAGTFTSYLLIKDFENDGV